MLTAHLINESKNHHNGQFPYYIRFVIHILIRCDSIVTDLLILIIFKVAILYLTYQQTLQGFTLALMFRIEQNQIDRFTKYLL